jgi:type IV pilus assembly protein PilO
MKKLSGSSASTAILLAALFAALIFAVYYYLVAPKKEEVEMAQNSVNSTNAEIQSLQQNIAVLQQEQLADSADVYELRKKVPENRAMRELILKIEELGFVTTTRISSINFNNYDSLVLESALQDPNQPPAEEITAETTTTETETSADGTTETTTETTETTETPTEGEAIENEPPPVSSIARETLPAELKMITFSLSLQAADKSSIEAYIKELETIERIMRIDNISYALPGEQDLLGEDAENSISASVQVTTFYYEGEE